MQFRYRLEPFDGKWIYSSGERTAIYTNLPPGKYEFNLQMGIDNQFTEYTLSKPIIIQAAWWQTVWAKIAGLLLMIGLAFLIYWIRLKALTSSNLRLERIVNERTQAIELQKQDLNQAFEQLKKAQEQMVQSDKMASLGILSAGVAHEINNPLNFIKGGVEGLEHTLLTNENINPEDYTVLLGAIKEGINRASAIVSSLNEFSHSTDGVFKPIDIHHLLENCLTMIQFRVKHDIALTKNFSNQELYVMGNNGKLHQAFLNILTNALQAIEGKGSIQINTRLQEDRIVLEFTDSGHGIKPENLKKITEPFFSTKDPGKGTGLGLSITYSIINEHNGTLSYSSEWGKGTTSTITLPALVDNRSLSDS